MYRNCKNFPKKVLHLGMIGIPKTGWGGMKRVLNEDGEKVFKSSVNKDGAYKR